MIRQSLIKTVSIKANDTAMTVRNIPIRFWKVNFWKKSRSGEPIIPIKIGILYVVCEI